MAQVGRYRAYPAYKPSGVAWLGDIPEGWEAKKLKFSSTHNDEVLSDNVSADWCIKYVDIGSVSAEGGIGETQDFEFGKAPSRARRVVKHGDVLVSTVRTYLKAIAPVISPPPNLIASTGFAVIRPTGDLNSDFASYALRTEGYVGEIVSQSVGVSYPAINASDAVQIHLPIPPSSEQIQIAVFLEYETAKIDALIAKQERLIALLEEKRQAMISHAVTKGLNLNAPLRPSGIDWLGDVPAHWEVKRLKHISPKIGVGLVINPSTYTRDEGRYFIFGGDVKEFEFDLQKTRRISAKDSESLKPSLLKQGDLVSIRVGFPGISAVVTEELDGANCASVIITRKGDFNSNWLCSLMNSWVGKKQVEVASYGAAQKQYNVSDAVEFVFPVPPPSEQLAIATKISESRSNFGDLIAKAQSAITLLKERRTALISAAVTGKIDVRDWQAPAATSTQDISQDA
mgnify:CR=1 FL=1|tara:strand:- start:15287 stop:16657 length:1371 start_codon:yes stop_codon:yes gene_type:complete